MPNKPMCHPKFPNAEDHLSSSLSLLDYLADSALLLFELVNNRILKNSKATRYGKIRTNSMG